MHDMCWWKRRVLTPIPTPPNISASLYQYSVRYGELAVSVLLSPVALIAHQRAISSNIGVARHKGAYVIRKTSDSVLSFQSSQIRDDTRLNWSGNGVPRLIWRSWACVPFAEAMHDSSEISLEGEPTCWKIRHSI